MKFLKLAIIVSCVLSAVLTRKSYSKKHDLSSAAFTSRIKCSNPTDCSPVCNNFKIIAKNINCHENHCEKEKCVCSPASGTQGIAPEDKCQYADASAIATPQKQETPKSQPAKNKRRRRY